MGILSFIMGNKNLVILAITAATFMGGAVYIKLLKSELATAIAEKNGVIAELQVSQVSVKNLMNSLTEQNTAIDKLKADADVRVTAHAAEIAKAKPPKLLVVADGPRVNQKDDVEKVAATRTIIKNVN